MRKERKRRQVRVKTMMITRRQREELGKSTKRQKKIWRKQRMRQY